MFYSVYSVQRQPTERTKAGELVVEIMVRFGEKRFDRIETE